VTRRFVPVPYDAIDLVPEWLALVDLYKRGHQKRWKPWESTTRSLATSWNLSTRRVGDILGVLEAAGLLTSGTDVVVVRDGDGILQGVVTKTDVMNQISTCQGAACQVSISSVMTRDVVWCQGYDRLQDVSERMKARHLKSAPPLAKVAWDAKLQLMKHVLGTHTSVSRVQGRQLKAKREIRIATLFKEAPADFLRMIVVHELAHLKEPEHDRAFYALCRHMAPDYLALELDLRLWLTARALAAAVPGGTLAAEGGPGPQSPQPPGAQACHTP
jgi:CBS domain-containing protein